ncbi:UrcA family protein [Sphingomonas koreensis]
MLFNLARAAAIAAALIAAVPAIAGGAKSVKVSYADLNLSSTTGRVVFAQRINAAVARVCGSPFQRDLAMAAESRRCATTTRESTGPAIQLAHRNAANRQLAARDMSVTVAP